MVLFRMPIEQYMLKKKKKASGNDQIVVLKLLWLFVVPMNDYLIFFFDQE